MSTNPLNEGLRRRVAPLKNRAMSWLRSGDGGHLPSRRASAVGALTLVIAMALSACGSSAGAPGAKPSVPPGDPIKVGTICTCSGVFAASSGAAGKIAQAWADDVNDHGGLNGHPIKLIVKDDGGVPEKALQAAKQLVEDEGVVAIVGAVTSQDEAFKAYLEEKQVPVVGGFPVAASFSSSPVYFISGAGAAVTAVGQYAQAAGAGLKKVGLLYCAESPACAQAAGLGQLAAPGYKLGFTSAKITASQPNYTAQCLAFKDAGVDAMFIAHNADVMSRVADSCAKVGYEPSYIGSLATFGPSLAKDPNFEGSIWNGGNADYEDTSVPGIKTFRDALKKWAPDLLGSDQLTPIAANSFFGGMLFEAASAAFGGFTPQTTPQQVMEGLYKLKDETLDGVAPPLNFVKGQPGFPTCYFEATLEDGALVSKNPGSPTCVPDEVVATLKQALAAG